MREVKESNMKWCTLLFVLLFNSMIASAIDYKQDSNRVFDKPIVIEDIVSKIMKHESGYKLSFRMHAAAYYLKSSNINFAAILNSLNKSKDKQSPIKLRVTSTYLEIIELVSD